MERNGYEAQQSSLLYVFVRFFDLSRPCTKPEKIQQVFTCVQATT